MTNDDSCCLEGREVMSPDVCLDVEGMPSPEGDCRYTYMQEGKCAPVCHRCIGAWRLLCALALLPYSELYQLMSA